MGKEIFPVELKDSGTSSQALLTLPVVLALNTMYGVAPTLAMASWHGPPEYALSARGTSFIVNFWPWIRPRRKHRGIVRVFVLNLDCRYHVGFRSAADMGLHPLLFLSGTTVLNVKPALNRQYAKPVESTANCDSTDRGGRTRHLQSGPAESDTVLDSQARFSTELKCGTLSMYPLACIAPGPM